MVSAIVYFCIYFWRMKINMLTCIVNVFIFISLTQENNKNSLERYEFPDPSPSNGLNSVTAVLL